MAETRFGVCIPIFACPGGNLFRTPGFDQLEAPASLDIGKRAEALGFDSLWVADHLMLGKEEAILEGWTVLSALAGATSTVKLGMIHQAHYFRHPSLTAKMAATLDQLSGGRLIHFMDCGYQGREYTSYGLPWKDDAAARAEDLDEAIELITALWTANGPVTFGGKMWQMDDAVCEPKPVQRPYPPLWFGDLNPDVVDLCARRGNGWNTTPVSVEDIRQKLEVLSDACDRIGRDMNEIELSLETQVLIAPDLDGLREKLRQLILLGGDQHHLPPEVAPYVHDYAQDESTLRFVEGDWDDLPEPMARDWIIGSPDMVRQRLNAYKEEGISHFMLWFMDAPDPSGMELFAAEFLDR